MSASGPKGRSLRLAARLDNLPAFRGFVLAAAKAPGLSPDRLPDVDLVLEEILVNVCSYAYAPSVGEVEVSCAERPAGAGPDPVSPRAFCLTIRDWGQPFDPLRQAAPDQEADIALRAKGGWGIRLVRERVDACAYAREQDQNVLTVCFDLPEKKGFWARFKGFFTRRSAASGPVGR